MKELANSLRKEWEIPSPGRVVNAILLRSFSSFAFGIDQLGFAGFSTTHVNIKLVFLENREINACVFFFLKGDLVMRYILETKWKMTLILYITFIIVNQFSRELFVLYDRGLAIRQMPLG